MTDGGSCGEIPISATISQNFVGPRAVVEARERAAAKYILSDRMWRRPCPCPLKLGHCVAINNRSERWPGSVILMRIS
jgi:hypothetical protein